MAELIERLTRCGVPQKTAECLAADFKRRNRLEALTIYVLLAEEENARE